MAIDIEVMYAEFTEAGQFLRIRAPLDQFRTLPRTNAIAVILSADTTPARARYSLNAGGPSSSTTTVVERLAQADAISGGHVIMRRKREVCLFSIGDGDVTWVIEENPFLDTNRRLRGLPVALPYGSAVFSTPDPPLSGVLRNDAMTAYILDMY